MCFLTLELLYSHIKFCGELFTYLPRDIRTIRFVPQLVSEIITCPLAYPNNHIVIKF